MRISSRVIAAATIAGAAGCTLPERPQMDSPASALNVRIVRALNDAAIKNAVITQHTLYPYHFILNSAQLNELGAKDLGVLIGHYTNNRGTLNVRQGNVPPALYKARVATVVDAMTEAGVDTQHVTIADGMPGGDGMASDRVVAILAEPSESATPSPTEQTAIRQAPTGAGRAQ